MKLRDVAPSRPARAASCADTRAFYARAHAGQRAKQHRRGWTSSAVLDECLARAWRAGRSVYIQISLHTCVYALCSSCTIHDDWCNRSPHTFIATRSVESNRERIGSETNRERNHQCDQVKSQLPTKMHYVRPQEVLGASPVVRLVLQHASPGETCFRSGRNPIRWIQLPTKMRYVNGREAKEARRAAR